MNNALQAAFAQAHKAKPAVATATPKVVTLQVSPVGKYHGMSRAAMRAEASAKAAREGISPTPPDDKA